MDYFGNSWGLHFGANAGASIFRAMQGAQKSIFVVSPYFSKTYVDFLTQRAAEGIAVTVLTHDDATRDMNDIYKQIVQQHCEINNNRKRIRRWGLLISALMLVCFSGLLLWELNSSQRVIETGVLIGLLLATLITLVVFQRLRTHFYSYSTLFDFLVLPRRLEDGTLSPDYVHAKIYIVDETQVFSGSANFTWNGFQKNLEVVAQFFDPLLCEALRQDILRFIEASQLTDLQDLGPGLYPEPPN